MIHYIGMPIAQTLTYKLTGFRIHVSVQFLVIYNIHFFSIIDSFWNGYITVLRRDQGLITLHQNLLHLQMYTVLVLTALVCHLSVASLR